MIRSRTSFLVSARNAPLISFSRPSNRTPSRSMARVLTRSVSDSRSCLPAIVSTLASSSENSLASAS